MRALRLSRWLVLAFALLLLGGQQAALAHLIGHIGDAGSTSAAVVAQQGDDEHGTALNLAHVCTTCIALDHFEAPPVSSAPLAFAGGSIAAPPAPTFSEIPATPPRRYAARAPPAPL
jgi:hypothetical protein